MKLIKYEASWCQPCKNMETVVHNVLASVVNDIEYERIDVDEIDDIDRVQLGIKMVPTFIIKNDRDMEIDRKAGTISQSDFKEWIEKYN